MISLKSKNNKNNGYLMKMVYSIQTKNNQFRNILGKKIVRYNEYQDDRKHQDFGEIPRKYIKIKCIFLIILIFLIFNNQ